MRWKGPTNPFNSIPILLGMALFCSVNPYLISSLLFMGNKKHFQQLENQLRRSTKHGGVSVGQSGA